MRLYLEKIVWTIPKLPKCEQMASGDAAIKSYNEIKSKNTRPIYSLSALKRKPKPI